MQNRRFATLCGELSRSFGSRGSKADGEHVILNLEDAEQCLSRKRSFRIGCINRHRVLVRVEQVRAFQHVVTQFDAVLVANNFEG